VKDHLLFLLFTKSVATPKSAAQGQCPPRSPSRAPTYRDSQVASSWTWWCDLHIEVKRPK